MAEQIKYKMISAHLVGKGNEVRYQLEDETLLILHVEIARVGVAEGRKNPDGTPIYSINLNVRMDFQTKDKVFYAPAPPVQMQMKSTPEKKPDYTS